MTNETRQFVTLDEVFAIRYECNNCGTAITVPSSKWNDTIPRSCPHCLTDPPSNWITKDSFEYHALRELQRNIKTLLDSKTMGCRISIEIVNTNSATAKP